MNELEKSWLLSHSTVLCPQRARSVFGGGISQKVQEVQGTTHGTHVNRGKVCLNTYLEQLTCLRQLRTSQKNVGCYHAKEGVLCKLIKKTTSVIGGGLSQKIQIVEKIRFDTRVNREKVYLNTYLELLICLGQLRTSQKKGGFITQTRLYCTKKTTSVIGGGLSEKSRQLRKLNLTHMLTEQKSA